MRRVTEGGEKYVTKSHQTEANNKKTLSIKYECEGRIDICFMEPGIGGRRNLTFDDDVSFKVSFDVRFGRAANYF